jgi:Scaffold protein Nfu/NifU N terminal
VATADPSPTPNPNALKFTLDTRLPEMFNVTSPEAAAGNPFAEALFAVDGVASVFGTGDFVTVNRRPGTDWDPIVAAVKEAAERYL